MRIIWQTVRRITNEILGVTGLSDMLCMCLSALSRIQSSLSITNIKIDSKVICFCRNCMAEVGQRSPA